MPPASMLRRVALGLVGQVQIVVDHLDKGLTVLFLVPRPHIVGVVVRSQINTLLLGVKILVQYRRQNKELENPWHKTKSIV